MKHLPLDLLERYREPVPRYTSYPAVMHWRAPPAADAWTGDLAATLASGVARLSLYVHIPFCQSLCSFCGCNVRIVRNHALADPYVDTLLREFALYRERLPGVPLTLGELMMVVGGFNQVQNALRWFIDQYPSIAEWEAVLLRV